MQPRTKKILIAAGVLTVLAVIGIVTGVVVSENKKNSSSNNVATAHTTSTTDNPHTVDPNGDDHDNDDSDTDTDTDTSFELNPALHKSFYGIAYTPYGAIPPACGATLANVTKDMEILSQLTPRLRLYGCDCNVTALVLQAIEDLDVDVSIFPGIFLEIEEESYLRQKTVLEQTLTNYGTSRILGVSVGNEYILLGGDTTEAATARVVEKMNEVRTDLAALGFDLDVGTSEAGGIPQEVADNADYVFVNVHPWFAPITIEDAAAWTDQVMEDTLEPIAALSPRNPLMYQGEVGWPGSSDSGGAANPGGSPAGITEMQTFLDDWVCPMNAEGKRYFWFSAFDEAWKSETGDVEAHWGLFNQDGTLKDITIPNCPLVD